MRKSPTKQIEEDPRTHEGERSYIKFPGKPLIDVTKKSERHSSLRDTDKIKNECKKAGRKTYSSVHNHPDLPLKEEAYSFPSNQDIKRFLGTNEENTMWIAQQYQHPAQGLVRGYFVLRKTKNTPKVFTRLEEDLPEVGDTDKIQALNRDVEEYANVVSSKNKTLTQKEKALSEIARKYALQTKYVPRKGFEREGGDYRFSPLENSLKVTIFILIISVFIYGYGSITGNAVLGLENISRNQASFGLLIGLFIIGFIYFKIKKNNSKRLEN